jgi:hypothetical protein
MWLIQLHVHRPRSKQFRWGRLPLAYFAGHRATNWLVFPCCLCAPLQGDVVESAVYIAATGPYRGFWVAGCAQDQCEYFGNQANFIQVNK